MVEQVIQHQHQEIKELSTAITQWGDNETKAKIAQVISMHMKHTLEPLIKKNRQTKMLDFGCGNGGITISLAEDVESIIGVDPSERAIQSFQQKMSDSGPCPKASYNTKAIQLDLLDEESQDSKKFLKEYENSFDIVICSLTFHSIKHVEKALEKMKLVLKEGGSVCICDVLKTDNSINFHPRGVSRSHVFHLGGFTLDEMTQWLLNTEFSDVKFEEYTIEKENSETNEMDLFPLFMVTATK